MADNLRSDPLLGDVPEVDGMKYLSPCVLYDRIGAGGMGTVFRGRHANLDIDVAVKCLEASLARRDEKFVTRFQREAKLAAAINHENLIRVYDVGSNHGVHYIVMEFVRGETARERVGRKGPLSEREALSILLGAACGLGAAHGRGIIHRDIKPDNIMISVDGRVKVADLGLAKPLEGAETLTMTQGIMGTPKYMAPEQWADPGRVGPWTDVWALGATLFFLLAGRDPFRGASVGQVFPDLRKARRGLSVPLLELLAKCVQADPEQRFTDARELTRKLRGLVDHDSEAELADPESGQNTSRMHLVSPPPPETLEKIRRGGVHEAPTIATPASPQFTPTATGGGGGRRWVWWAAAAAVLAAGSGAWALAGRGGGATDLTRVEMALANEDFDGAVAILDQLLQGGGGDAAVKSRLAAVLVARANRRRDAGAFTGGIADLDRAATLAPGPEVATARTRLEREIAAALSRDTTLSLADGAVVAHRCELAVTAADADVKGFTVQDRAVELDGGTAKTTLVFAADGPTTLPVRLEHRTGVTATVEVGLIVDGTPPTVDCETPADGATVRAPLELSGSAADAHPKEVRIGSSSTPVTDGRWRITLPLDEGRQTLRIQAVDAAGNTSDALVRSVTIDGTPPALELEKLPAETADATVAIIGRTEPGAKVTIDGRPQPTDADGSFRGEVALPRIGSQEIAVAATDAAGNTATQTITLVRRGVAAPLTVVEPAGGEAVRRAVIAVRGEVGPTTRSLAIAGTAVPVTESRSFTYFHQLRDETAASLTIVAEDNAGKRTTTEIRLVPPPRLPLSASPPPPSSGAEVVVTGETAPGAAVRVGDEPATVAADGRFEARITVPGTGSFALPVQAWRPGDRPPAHLGVRLPVEFAAEARIETVAPGSAADAAGLRAGSVIEAVDGVAVDAQELLAALADRAPGPATLRVRDAAGGSSRDVTVRLWPEPAATTQVTVRVGAADGPPSLLPIFGVDPGITTEDEVARLGTKTDDRLMRTYRVGGHEVLCERGFAIRFVLTDAEALPPDWRRLGITWGSSLADCQAIAREQSWSEFRVVPAALRREGVLEVEPRPGLRVILTFPRDRLNRAEVKATR